MARRSFAPPPRVLAGLAAATLFAGGAVAQEPEAAPLVAPRPAERLLPDRALEAAVRDELHLEPDAKLKAEDLRKLYFLRAPDGAVRRLDGLGACVNLALIDLSGNAISDLAPLAPLANLQSLDLSGNAIESLAPLSELTGLQYLKLDGNRVADLGPLRGLERLSALYLPNNRVTELGPLEESDGLTSLDLAGNGVKEVGPLAGLSRLSAVTLSDNAITNVAPLAGLTDLRFLILKNNQVADLAPLVAAATADAAGPGRFAPYLRLYLAGNPLGEASEEQIAALEAAGVRVILEEPATDEPAGTGDEPAGTDE